jgi:hypothetical protein
MSPTGVAGLARGPAASVTHMVEDACAAVDGWRVDHDDVWVRADHELARTPAQGWKLHVTAAAGEADAVLAAVLPVLVAERTSFKVLASAERLASVNRGEGGRSQVGKFLTVYPGDDDEAVSLAGRLDRATRGRRGPRIPSDRRLRSDSVVSYRYGAFEGRWMQTPIGAVVPALESPDGTVVPDHRARFYVGPAWVDDPFEAAGAVEVPPAPSLVVRDRYLLVSVLASTSEGSVHLAVDLVTGGNCVLKRARGDAGALPGFGPVDRLRREAELLAHLADEPSVPDLVELFTADGDVYLAMERVVGTSLEELVAEVTVAGRHLPPEAVVRYATATAVAVGRLHARGLLHGDLKPPHIFAVDDGIRLVDVESIRGVPGDDVHEVLGTPGYASPQRFAGEPLCVADDVHSFGGVLAYLLTGADPSHAPDRRRVLDRSVELLRPGAPAGLAVLVARCLSADPAERPESMEAVLDALRRRARVDGSPSCRSLVTPPSQVNEPDRSSRHSTRFHDRPGPEAPVRAVTATDVERTGVLDSARRLARDLCARATTAGPGDGSRPTAVWREAHDGRPVLRDLNVGVAGIVMVLAEVVDVLGEACVDETLPAAARWLAGSEPLPGGPLPGLYVGEAGIAAALRCAGTVLDDRSLIAAARARAELVASLPFTSPDLYNGTAGRVRAHLLAWQATGDGAEIDRALAGADHLADRALLMPDGSVRWLIPPGYEGPEATEYLGYAHGAAGIADVLVDIVRLTGEPRFVPLIESAVAGLVHTAVPTLGDGSGCTWPDRPGGRNMQPLWCHGGGGVARFLDRAGRLLGDDEAITLAGRARRAAAATRVVGPSHCHGLAGTIELLLDAGADADPALADLTELLVRFLVPADDLEPSSPLALREDGLMTGRAGVLRCLVRLARPDRIGPLLLPREV